jgi:hypothetical protein
MTVFIPFEIIYLNICFHDTKTCFSKWKPSGAALLCAFHICEQIFMMWDVDRYFRKAYPYAAANRAALFDKAVPRCRRESLMTTCINRALYLPSSAVVTGDGLVG